MKFMVKIETSIKSKMKPDDEIVHVNLYYVLVLL